MAKWERERKKLKLIKPVNSTHMLHLLRTLVYSSHITSCYTKSPHLSLMNVNLIIKINDLFIFRLYLPLWRSSFNTYLVSSNTRVYLANFQTHWGLPEIPDRTEVSCGYFWYRYRLRLRVEYMQKINFHNPLISGPVLFPSAPIGPETSGVRVGASGFGFVPPGGRGRGLYTIYNNDAPMRTMYDYL